MAGGGRRFLRSIAGAGMSAPTDMPPPPDGEGHGPAARILDALDAAQPVTDGVVEAGEPKAKQKGGKRPKKADVAAEAETGSEGVGVPVDTIEVNFTDGYDLDAMNREWAMVLMGSKAVIIRETPNGPIEDRFRVLSIEAFNAWFSNRMTAVLTEKGLRWVSYSTKWLRERKRRSYVGVEFAPGDGPLTDGYLNLWQGFSVVPKPGGSWAILRDHLMTNVCRGDPTYFTWVMGWMAHMVQRPRERIGTALVFRGKMGTGKSKVGEVLGSLIAAHYFQVDDPRYITGNFNAHMASCLLLQAEEAVWAGDPVAAGRLKGLITSAYQQIEAKGVDPIRLKNYVRLIMTSNESWVVPAGKEERRYAVFDVADHVMQDTEYFAAMDRELDDGGREAFLHALLTFDLNQVDLRRIPRTDGLLAQKIESLEPFDRFWFERLCDGAQIPGDPEWAAEVAKVKLWDAYTEMADTAGIKRRGWESQGGERLRELVPGLKERRPSFHEDTKRQRVWVFPSLEECREAFARAMQQDIRWPDGETATGRKGVDRDD